MKCFVEIPWRKTNEVFFFLFLFAVNFDHFQILRAIGKGSFGKVKDKVGNLWGKEMEMNKCSTVKTSIS